MDRPPGAYDRLAAAYDASERGARWKLYDHVTWATVAPLLPPPGARVLDAGAGSGKFAVRFLARGDEVTLLDPSRAMLDVAEAKVRAQFPQGKARFVQGSIEHIDAPDESFDVVFCEGDPLSYCLTTHAAAARELLRVLRPGGVFYVSVDSRGMGVLGFLARGEPERALACAERGESMDPYGMPTHAFRPEELRRELEAAGGVDVQVAGKLGIVHLLPPAALDALMARPGLAEELLKLETGLARDAAFAGLAGHLHAVGRKGRPRFRPRDGLVVSGDGDARYLTDLATGQVWELNASGVAVYHAAGRGAGLEGIVAALQGLYPDVPREELARDAREMLDELLRIGVLQQV